MQEQRGFRDSVALGGWLLADLMLALVMVALAAGTRVLPPPSPSISQVEPNAGKIGDTVRIHGQDLRAVEDVRFLDARATFEVVSANEIVARVPPNAQTGQLRVESRPYRQFDDSVPSADSRAGNFGLSRDLFQVAPTATLPASPTGTPTATPTLTPTLTVTPTVTPTVTVTATSTVTPTPLPELKLAPECWSYRTTLRTASSGGVDADQQKVMELFDRSVGASGQTNGRQAGFVLTFAQGQDDGDGKRTAQQVNDLLARTRRDLFEKTQFKAYLQRGQALGAVEIQVYYFSSTLPWPSNVSRCVD